MQSVRGFIDDQPPTPSISSSIWDALQTIQDTLEGGKEGFYKARIAILVYCVLLNVYKAPR